MSGSSGNMARISFVVFLALVPCCPGCAADEPLTPPDAEELARYAAQSEATSPGGHEDMYDNLPADMKELVGLVKCQLIHPFDLAREHRDIRDAWRFEDLDFPDVRGMLGGLAGRGDAGLTCERVPRERLMVACWHHGLLLASMLRHAGVPVRVRAGFATYIGRGSGLRFGHVVCEAWDGKRERWFLVDPDRERIDVPRGQFESASEAWRGMRGGGNVESYRSAQFEGAPAIAHLLLLDTGCVLRDEHPYWNDPDIVAACEEGVDALSSGERDLLDQIAWLLADVDGSIDTLRAIVERTPALAVVDRTEEIRRQFSYEFRRDR